MPNSHTLDQNLQRLITARTSIADAIVQKGGNVSQGDGFEDFPSDIASITNTYTASDEGKVVLNGALVPQTSTSVSQNGTINTTTIKSVTVAVPTYSAADNGKVIQNGSLTTQGTHKSITSNGTGIDTTYYSSVDVAVPNSYSAGDEGKVVSNGELVVQSTHKPITANGTGIDTTYYSSVDVMVDPVVEQGVFIPNTDILDTVYYSSIYKMGNVICGYIQATAKAYSYDIYNIIGRITGISFPTGTPTFKSLATGYLTTTDAAVIDMQFDSTTGELSARAVSRSGSLYSRFSFMLIW